MQVFVSWSGQQSKAIAIALSNWLPDVIQSIEVWMSEHDIAAGSKWSEQISDVLENSNFGVICLTPDNQNAPWLLATNERALSSSGNEGGQNFILLTYKRRERQKSPRTVNSTTP